VLRVWPVTARHAGRFMSDVIDFVTQATDRDNTVSRRGTTAGWYRCPVQGLHTTEPGRVNAVCTRAASVRCNGGRCVTR
jgi:hypothetical protein